MGASDSLEQRKEAKRRWIDPREDGAKERGRVRDGTGAEAAKEQAPRRRAFWGDADYDAYTRCATQNPEIGNLT